MSEHSEDMCHVKNGFNMYFSDDEAKELSQSVITFISLTRMNGLKGRGRGETHVTLTQEMNGQLKVSVPFYCLWYNLSDI